MLVVLGEIQHAVWNTDPTKLWNSLTVAAVMTISTDSFERGLDSQSKVPLTSICSLHLQRQQASEYQCWEELDTERIQERN